MCFFFSRRFFSHTMIRIILDVLVSSLECSCDRYEHMRGLYSTCPRESGPVEFDVAGSTDWWDFVDTLERYVRDDWEENVRIVDKDIDDEMAMAKGFAGYGIWQRLDCDECSGQLAFCRCEADLGTVADAFPGRTCVRLAIRL